MQQQVDQAVQNSEAQIKDGFLQNNKFMIKYILLMFTFCLNAVQFTSIPILFYRSKLNCLNSEGKEYECSLEQACQNSNGYVEKSEYPQIYNITMQLNLYCDREIIEAWIFSIANFGRIAACIILILTPHFKKENRETFINMTSVVTGLALLSLYLAHSTFMFIFGLFTWYLSSSFLYGLVFVHLWEYFPESYQKYGAAILNNSCPFMMVIFLIFSYYYGSWKNTLIHFTGIPLLIIGLLSIYLQAKLTISSPNSTQQIDMQYRIFENQQESEQKDNDLQFQDSQQSSPNQEIKQINLQQHKKYTDDESQGETSSTSEKPTQDQVSGQEIQNFNEITSQADNNLQTNSKIMVIIENYFPFLNRGTVLRKNFYIWTLCLSSYVANYYGVCFLLNSLHGNLYFNCLLSTIFELFSNFIATALVVKYNNSIKTLLIVTQFITGVAFVSAFFISDTKDSVVNSYQDKEMQFTDIMLLILYLSPIIIAKISFEITPSLLFTYQKTVIPVAYQQQQYSCSSIFTMIVSNVIPFYKYFLIQMGINPFIGFGVFTLFSAYQSKNFMAITNNENQKNNTVK
ncbi:transmembrane protein, putative (macronuclear) [Tetrahymena thermophila SB210]|uniref:Transmembrane protein, putative n=1 Tax=Tetrahymena thermophila (strain SB210) TaxID=312017 RepID=Q22NX0_TETTS|nr:transmembrane protein, putative [Tetrahymena thermophila SB210]EAR87041.2 transmembrane protein, putative [Tetrahymena thermophila SB210]|eukprot:XP_001007286.2 transmembrane protein, putative [Tetrahymena thermophila SB210]